MYDFIGSPARVYRQPKHGFVHLLGQSLRCVLFSLSNEDLQKSNDASNDSIVSRPRDEMGAGVGFNNISDAAENVSVLAQDCFEHSTVSPSLYITVCMSVLYA